jgi:squalene-hopene/tetraprenyl-beta-curcumene cyclase
MFGRFPSLRSHPRVRSAVAKAIEYLKTGQENDGSWYGRWGVNYVYGTWQALKGLIEVGESPDQDYIRRAVSFLKHRQNADGGWGESCQSYEEASTAEEGNGQECASTASQTGWALMGLIATGEIDSPEVARGMRYLLDTQLEDGGWRDESWTGTGFPRVFYLKYHLYQIYFPLFALGHYRNVRDGVPSIDERLEIDLERRYDKATAAVPGLLS